VALCERGSTGRPSGGVDGDMVESEDEELARGATACGFDACERGVGYPCNCSKQSSQTRASTTRAFGAANCEMGVFLGGRRNGRLAVSSRAVVRALQAWQKIPPHLRQCCLQDPGEHDGDARRLIMIVAMR
jgi:hypothetical protein